MSKGCVRFLKILNLNKEKIEHAIKNGDVTIAVFGAGKVGLPIAVIFGDLGAKIIAVDIDQEIVDKINKGENPIENEAEMEEKFRNCIKKGNLEATSDLVKAAKESDVMIVIVPTLLNEDKSMNMTAVTAVFENIGLGLDLGDLVILESTVPPNYTEGTLKKILENKSKLIAGKDFGLGFSPERVYSGRIIPDILYRYPKIVSGIDERTSEIMKILYGMVAQKGVIKLSSIRAAETEKVFEGIYRDVNIALANELALIAEKLNLDIMEIREAANSQPFCNILIPGAGVGGHCIPVYPYFIINLDQVNNLALRLTRAAREVNEEMPLHVIDLLNEGLKEINKSYQDASISIMGLAFRGDVKEYRNSPTLPIVNYLKNITKNIKIFDPLFSKDEIFDILGIEGEISISETLQNADCVIFLTDHSAFKTLDMKHVANLIKKPGLIIDGRQIFDPNLILKLGIHYKGIGRVTRL